MPNWHRLLDRSVTRLRQKRPRLEAPSSSSSSSLLLQVQRPEQQLQQVQQRRGSDSGSHSFSVSTPLSEAIVPSPGTSTSTPAAFRTADTASSSIVFSAGAKHCSVHVLHSFHLNFFFIQPNKDPRPSNPPSSSSSSSSSASAGASLVLELCRSNAAASGCAKKLAQLFVESSEQGTRNAHCTGCSPD